MTRASWYLRRHEVRSAYPTRADRGLPKHPDGSGLAPCPRCGSEGCSLCDGTTFIADGYRDPLLRLRYARQPYVRRRDPSQYQHLRQVIAATRHPLRLIEACVGAELAARGAVQAWSKVA